MSRWQEQFDIHPFQKLWLELKEKLEDIQVDDESITTDVEEVARLKKVVNYLD